MNFGAGKSNDDLDFIDAARRPSSIVYNLYKAPNHDTDPSVSRKGNASQNPPRLNPLQIHVAGGARALGKSQIQKSEGGVPEFIQQTFANFTLLEDTQRNALLKGLLDRSSTKQIEFVYSHLNFLLAKHAVPIPSNAYPATKQYRWTKGTTDPKLPIPDITPNNPDQNEEEIQKHTAADDAFSTANTYIKLANAQYDYDRLTQQMQNGSNESLKKCVHFLALRCQKMQRILAATSDITRETNFTKTISTLMQCMTTVLNAKQATLYVLDENSDSKSTLMVEQSTWLKHGDQVKMNRLFHARDLSKGKLVNLYNVKELVEFLREADEIYGASDMDCILSCPIISETTNCVIGVVEFINKNLGHPFFDAEDEALVQMTACLWTMLLNDPRRRQGTGHYDGVVNAFEQLCSLLSSEMDMNDVVTAVTESTRSLMKSEFSSLYLVDETGTQIAKLPISQNAAEFIPVSPQNIVAEIVNIYRPYDDPRFDKKEDQRNGTRTRNILCTPIFDRDRKVIAVIQCRNKLPASASFDKDDEKLMHAFATLLPVLIKKVIVDKMIHAEMEENSRIGDYFSNVMTSMPEALLTFNLEGKLIQYCGQQGLELDSVMDKMTTTKFEQWLGSENKDLIRDLKKCLRSGDNFAETEYELLLNGETYLVNYTVSPIRPSGRTKKQLLGNPKLFFQPPSIPSLFQSSFQNVDSLMSNQLSKTANPNRSSPITGVLLRLHPQTTLTRTRTILSTKLYPTIAFADVLDMYPVTQTLQDMCFLGVKQSTTILCVELLDAFTSVRLEVMSTAELSKFVNKVWQEISQVVASEQGVVDKFINNTAVAFFGGILNHDDDANRAIRTALKIRNELSRLNKENISAGRPALKFGIGVASGNVVTATFGARKKMEYSFLGGIPPVYDTSTSIRESYTFASSLASLSRTFDTPILIADSTKSLLTRSYMSRELDRIRIMAMGKSISVWEVLADASEMGSGDLLDFVGTPVGMGVGEKKTIPTEWMDDVPEQERMSAMVCYELGLSEYRTQNWSSALIHFKKVLSHIPQDGPAKAMYKRCETLMKDPKYKSLGSDWDGAWPPE